MFKPRLQQSQTATATAPTGNRAQSVSRVAGLQQSFGNRAVRDWVIQRKCACGNAASDGGECAECSGRKVQAKLAVGADHHPLEQEADRIAHRVAAGEQSTAPRSAPVSVQRVSKGAGAGPGDAPASVHRVLSGSGRPLDTPLRQDMERGFGHDFSQVRIHTGAEADASAREIDARAYTAGRDIVFANGQYDSSHRAGRQLIAHELTHVLQQSGGAPLVQRSKISVAGCGMVNLAASLTGIGSLAHIQIQKYLSAKGISSELPIPRATKAELGWGCRKFGTEWGYADLSQKSATGIDLGEIKPVTMSGRALAKLEVGHYRRRATQSTQRLYKRGACGTRPAGVDDVFFGTTNALTSLSGFSLLSGVLAGDVTIGPFDGDPSLTLKVKEASPGAFCYWCTKGKPADKPEASKPAGPNAGLGISIGGSSSGGYNAGIGVSIMSDSSAFGTAGVGISYKSDSKAAGAAGAGATAESDSIAGAAVGAGASKDTQSIGAGVAGAGTSSGSVSAAAGAAGAGSSKDSATAGAGVAGKGTVTDSAVAGAGSTGSGTMKGVQGVGTGSPSGPVDSKDGTGSNKPPAQTPTNTPGDPGHAGTGQQPGTGKGTAQGADAGTAGDATTGTGQGAAPAPGIGGPDSAAAKGAQAAQDAGPDKVTGGSSTTGTPGGTDAGSTQNPLGGTGATAAGGGLGVGPVTAPYATDADRQLAAQEATKVAKLLNGASAPQIALFRYLAQSSPTGQYVVPASQWVDRLMQATAGLSEDDIKYLQSLNWKPSTLSADELRKVILELLKTKPAPGTSTQSPTAAKPAAPASGSDGGTGASAGKGSSAGSGTATTGQKTGPASQPGFVQPQPYTGTIQGVDPLGFEIKPNNQITKSTRKGAKAVFEVNWLENGVLKRANVEYEVIADPVATVDPDTKKKLLRFDIQSTNTAPLLLSPANGPDKPTVLPAHAPGSYYIYSK